MDAERSKELRSDVQPQDGLRIRRRRYHDVTDERRRHRRKGSATLLPSYVRAVGQPHSWFARAFGPRGECNYEAFCVREVQGPEQPRVDDAENGDGSADGNRQGRKDHSREAGIPAQYASSMRQIPGEILDPRDNGLIAAHVSNERRWPARGWYMRRDVLRPGTAPPGDRRRSPPGREIEAPPQFHDVHPSEARRLETRNAVCGGATYTPSTWV